jgi:hypothetical protein
LLLRLVEFVFPDEVQLFGVDTGGTRRTTVTAGAALPAAGSRLTA